MDVSCFMPSPSELFPMPESDLASLRELQKNTAFQLMTQRLRAEAYAAGMTGAEERKGLMRAVAVIGEVEFGLQREPDRGGATEEEFGY